MALKVPGMPAKFKFGVPAPGFQSGLPLSNLAERLNRYPPEPRGETEAHWNGLHGGLRSLDARHCR